jgi:hypothetical protein
MVVLIYLNKCHGRRNNHYNRKIMDILSIAIFVTIIINYLKHKEYNNQRKFCHVRTD